MFEVHTWSLYHTTEQGRGPSFALKKKKSQQNMHEGWGGSMNMALCFKIKRLQAYSLLPGINENISKIFSQRLPLLPQTTLGVSLLVTNLSNLRVTLGFCSSFSKNPETRRPLGPSKQHRIRKSDAELILMQTNFKNKFKSFGNLPDLGISLRFNGIYYSKKEERRTKQEWLEV